MTFLRQSCVFYIIVTAAIGSAVYGQQPANKTDPKAADAKSDVVWTDAQQLTIEGQGFTDTVGPYDRLPGRAKEKVRPAVWNLSRHSAGLCVRFVTNATTIHARWNLHSKKLAMPHMPSTGVSGLDLYAKDDDGRWRWVVCGFPTAQQNESRLITGLAEGEREYLLYFPLYNGVTEVSVGVPPGSQITEGPARPTDHKPIVFYGTSITQGGCASRPGMVHTAILGRQLNRPVINLGFSGNGEMEADVGSFIAEIDASVFVIDCLPNMVAAEVNERTAPLIAILRKAHPTTPIVLVEDRNYTNSWILKSKRVRNAANQLALRSVYGQLTPTDSRLFYLSAVDLLGNDGEATVDSSHPTDLGFERQSRAFRKVIAPLVGESVE